MIKDDMYGDSLQTGNAPVQLLRLGYIGALLATIVGYAYLVGYVFLLLRYPIRPWSGIQAFAEAYLTPYGIELTILQALAFLQTLSIAATVIALGQSARQGERVFARLAETAATVW